MAAQPATNGQFGVYTRTHAQQINSRYNNAAANYVTPKERWNQVLGMLPTLEKHGSISKLTAAIKKFEKMYPNIKKFNDPNFRICRAIPVALSHCSIDTTIQRHLDVDWVIKIIENFTAYQAMPIQMYRVAATDVPKGWPRNVEYWAAWDGQHTLVAFWIIATMIFNQDPDEVLIPMVEYDMQSRLECRVTFMKGNSKEGKKVMSPIDLAMQQIYAVRLDKVNHPDWVLVERKQSALEAYDLFMTDSKFHDDKEPGAISRPGDIVDVKYTVEQIRQFSIYADRVLNQNPRSIDTKELPIILGFLRMAAMSDLKYTDEEVESLADLCIELFDANFHEDGPFWAQVCQAYINWHTAYHADMDETLRPGIKLNKDWAQGGTYFWYQLKKSWKGNNGKPMRMPQLNIQTSFRPAAQDLL